MSKYDTWAKVDLRNACKAAGIKGWGKLTNGGMRDALVAHYAVPQVETLTAEDKAADAFTAAEKAASVEAPAAPVEAAAPAAEKPAKPKKAAKPAAPKVALDQRNGVTRPRVGSICANIWDACDAILAADQKITFAGLKEKLPKVNDSTIRTQAQRHRTYHK